MKNNVKDYIKQIKSKSEGQLNVSYAQFLEIYVTLKKPETNIIKIYNEIYGTFRNNPKISFLIKDKKKLTDFYSIDNAYILDVDKHQKNLLIFILSEFVQGNGFLKKFIRLVTTLIPILLLNVILVNFVTNENLVSTFNAILNSLSLFIAIFVLFAINQNYWDRKKLILFRKGKLGYYFSVDRNIATLGIISILTSLIGIMVTPLNGDLLVRSWSAKTYISLSLINIGFLFTFILLRSIVEFYIPRPAKFVLGDLKKESLENFDNNLKL